MNKYELLKINLNKYELLKINLDKRQIDKNCRKIGRQKDDEWDSGNIQMSFNELLRSKKGMGGQYHQNLLTY